MNIVVFLEKGVRCGMFFTSDVNILPVLLQFNVQNSMSLIYQPWLVEELLCFTEINLSFRFVSLMHFAPDLLYAQN